MKRSYALSTIRLVATLIVLEFHIFYFFCNKSLPFIDLLSEGKTMLTVMSGFLYSSKVITNIKGFYGKNIKKLIIPAFTAILIIAIFDLGYMLATKNYNYFSLWFGTREANGASVFIIGNFYYLGYIFVCYLITPCLQNFKKVYNKIIVISLIVGETVMSFFLGSPILISSFAIGYFVGRILFQKYLDPKQNTTNHALLYLVGVIASISIYVLSIKLIGNSSLEEKGILFIHNFAKFAFGTTTFFAFILIFKFINKCKKSNLLNFTDKICYPIYLLNQFFMCGASSIGQLVSNFGLQHLIVFPATILLGTVCYYLSYLFEKKIFVKR